MDGKMPNVAGGRRKAPKVLWLVGAALLAVIVSRSASFGAFRRPTAADIHSEYVKYLSGRDTVTAYLAYPERPNPAPAVIVIHEIFGMSDFVKQTTEQLAKDGFVAIAPDLLSRRGGTPATQDSARKLIATLTRDSIAVRRGTDSVTMDLNATRDFLNKLKAVRAGEIGIIGFCWGGGQSFRYATNAPELKAFVVCYGPSPDPAAMSRIRAKGLGVYGENDARINAGLNDATAAMKAAGKDYPYSVYPGVGHGFLRSRENPAVADSAWANVIRFFRAQLKS
jgi:carboxymethylenebutenolidase